MHDIQFLPWFGHHHGVSFKESESCNGFHWRSPSVFMSLYQIIYARSLKSSSIIHLLSLPVYTVYVLALLWLVSRGPMRVSPRLSFWMIILDPIMSFISKHIRQNTGFHCILLPLCTVGVLHWFFTTLASKYVADTCNNNGQCNEQHQSRDSCCEKQTKTSHLDKDEHDGNITTSDIEWRHINCSQWGSHTDLVDFSV